MVVNWENYQPEEPAEKARDREAWQVRRFESSSLEAADHRRPWALDVDRILHSKAYTRYIDKTQVFYLLKNDHITHRVLHVQMVSRVARTIGRDLGLDADLLEAIALGHDLGHPPFGHDGERFLSALCLAAGLEPFSHAVMSVRFLERLEKRGRGLNLTLGTLDGILCHDGESDYTDLKPEGRADFAEYDRRLALRRADPRTSLRPLSPEGCLVRLCDSVGYVGRDLEDAIEVGLVDRGELPAEVAEVLGHTNGQIVYRLVDDLRRTSAARREEGLIGFSPDVARALIQLKDFNRRHIYFNPAIKSETPKIERLYGILFERLQAEFESGQPGLSQAREFLDQLDPDYPLEHSPAEIARDALASMTDDYFLRLAGDVLMPGWRISHF
ncbi:MAG: HD domain-containing protein [Acidobacteriota bacterium]|nr:HD domain-containing protein [Acidobacteriota bacterium]